MEGQQRRLPALDLLVLCAGRRHARSFKRIVSSHQESADDVPLSGRRDPTVLRILHSNQIFTDALSLPWVARMWWAPRLGRHDSAGWPSMVQVTERLAGEARSGGC